MSCSVWLTGQTVIASSWIFPAWHNYQVRCWESY